MKQPDERAGFWIKSTQVRSLVRIAVVASESQVFAVVCSAMLASNDVLDVIGEAEVGTQLRASISAPSARATVNAEKFVGQFLDPTLHLRVGAETEQRLGARSVKALPDSRKHALQSNLR